MDRFRKKSMEGIIKQYLVFLGLSLWMDFQGTLEMNFLIFFFQKFEIKLICKNKKNFILQEKKSGYTIIVYMCMEIIFC